MSLRIQLIQCYQDNLLSLHETAELSSTSFHAPHQWQYYTHEEEHNSADNPDLVSYKVSKNMQTQIQWA